MADWSPAIANEFIRRAARSNAAFTQMQLQKLVYISHGWNLAINGDRLTIDDPQAWDYGPVYKELREALRDYGRSPISKEIRYCDFGLGSFMADDPEQVVTAELTDPERLVIDRVYRDYGRFHAFQLSALTHKPGTPWSHVYDEGEGRFDQIPSDLIRHHFVELATRRTGPNA